MDDLTKRDEDDLVPTGWRPETISDYEFVLRRIGRARIAIAHIHSEAARAKDAITTREQYLVAKEERDIAYIEAVAKESADAIKDDLLVGKKKSRDLLNGRIGWRKRGGKLRVENEDELREWLSNEGDLTLMRIVVQPEMKALQELCRTTGVIPPGCTWEPERDEIYLEPTPMPTIETHTKKELDK